MENNIASMLSYVLQSVPANALHSVLNSDSENDSRLDRAIENSKEKPFKIETICIGENDELSGDFYNDKALFFKDGSVEVVSYKGEGLHSFDSVAEYNERMTAAAKREFKHKLYNKQLDKLCSANIMRKCRSDKSFADRINSLFVRIEAKLNNL